MTTLIEGRKKCQKEGNEIFRYKRQKFTKNIIIIIKEADTDHRTL